MSIKTRNEIEERFKWDLTTIYKNLDEFNLEYDKVFIAIEIIKNYEHRVMESSDTLLELYEQQNKLSRRILKLAQYAYLIFNEDTSNPIAYELQGKIEILYDKWNLITSFITPEVVANSNLIPEFLNKNPDLKKYERSLYLLVKDKHRILSKEEEMILDKISKVLSSGSNSYDIFTGSELEFNDIKKDNETIKLTENNYSIYINDKDQNVRREAFKSLLGGYKKHAKTITSFYKNDVQENNLFSALRKYNSTLESAVLSNELNEKIVYNLVEVINENMPVFVKYFNYKKQYLNIDEYHVYDRYINMVSDYDRKYSIKEAKELVLKTLSVLGEEYLNIINRAFNERWIDFLPNESKANGAFSYGTYDTNKFILTNYNELYNDVSTLIHELGHSVHSEFAAANNHYHESGYSIFVAEVASQVNELLLTNYMLKNSTSNAEKKYLISEALDRFISTMHRQTMFTEFEIFAHEKEQNNEVLTSEMLTKYYYKLNQKYFQDSLILDEEIGYEWLRIPHFYRAFYVYQYATSFAASIKISQDIINQKENAVENYLKFLKTGDSMDPLSELKIAGVDLEDKTVIEESIKYFDNLLEEFKQLTKGDN